MLLTGWGCGAGLAGRGVRRLKKLLGNVSEQIHSTGASNTNPDGYTPRDGIKMYFMSKKLKASKRQAGEGERLTRFTH